jgi:drug/metabolite transporter (DMT)-like permease
MLFSITTECDLPLSTADPDLLKQSPALTWIDVLLLAMVSIAWGLMFPVMKLGLETYPPITFRGLSIVIGIITMAAYVLFRRQSLRVPITELRKLFVISQFNLTGWQLGLLSGILLLGASRSAIVGYTMPVWAFVTSILLYGGAISRRGVLGVTLAFLAVIVMTLNDVSHFLSAPTGLILLLIGAMCWGAGTAMTRHTPMKMSNESMAFWALMCTMPVYIPLTYWLERHLWRWPNFTEAWTMLYGGLVSFAFCYVVWYRLSRKLPPVVSSLSIMLVPVIGVVSSAVTLNEQVTALDWLALVIILLAMAVVLLPAHLLGFKRPEQSSY